MAKISLQDSGKYSTHGANDFFSLADDGDIAKVRFLYEQPDGSDMDYYLVHEVEIDGKKRYVACLAIDDEGNLNAGDCPLCEAGYKRVEKLFLQLYVEDEDKVKTWDRGKTFVPKIMTYLNRYGSLVSQSIEIERRGKKGSTKTTYEMFPLEKDNKTVADFPEKQELLGSFILDLNAQDCEKVIDGTYVLPNSDNHDTGNRRETTSNRRTTQSENTTPRGRRTRTASSQDNF